MSRRSRWQYVLIVSSASWLLLFAAEALLRWAGVVHLDLPSLIAQVSVATTATAVGATMRRQRRLHRASEEPCGEPGPMLPYADLLHATAAPSADLDPSLPRD
jgi:hypothetical protein